MRICMVLYDPQEAGGLEEYVTTLTIGLKELGQDVSVVSATWTPPDNQYVTRLRERGVPVVQPPRWLSRAGSHWPTKERLLERTLMLLSPLVAVLGVLHALRHRARWTHSRRSARNWLRGLLTHYLVGPDRRPLLGRLLLVWWRRLWRPDLLHVQGYASSLLFVVDWAHSKTVPVVYEEHQTPDARFDWWKDFGDTVNRAALVIAVSEESKRALKGVCGIDRPIVARDPLLPDPVTTGWRRRSRRPDDPAVRLTTIARLDVTKGLEYLVEAIPLVLARCPTAEFRVYGEGPQRQALLSRATELGLDGSRVFVGAFTSRDELSRIMAETDIFVLSSILEGQPLGLVEAMAYQCPIVATSVGGIPELIQDGVNGLLCAPRDPQALARHVVALIEDETLRMRLGLAARHSYEEGPFQPASVCARFTSIYDDVLRGRTPRLAS